MTFDSGTIRNGSIGILCITLAVCVAVVARNVNRAARTLADYAEVQAAQLQSEKSQKAIEAGIAAAASFQATSRLLNVTTIPAINDTIKAARASVEDLGDSARSLDRLISNTDAQINRALIPSANETLKAATGTLTSASGTLNTASKSVEKYGQTAEQLNQTIADLNKEGAVTMQEVRALLASEDIKRTLASLGETSANLAAVTKNVEAITSNTAEASKQMPVIAADVQRFTSTTSKFRRVILVAQLASILAPFIR